MKRNYFSFVTLLLVMILTAGCCLTAKNSTTQTETQKPKYVFLLIGDGMGKPHVDLARDVFGKLNMDKLPVRGSVSTVNANKGITDSAASGTAFACGVKTINGRLGIDADGNKVDSSAVVAKRSGKMVAVLTTVGLNNATPAAFYAHVEKRGMSKEIVAQFPDSGIDLLAGTGIDGASTKVKEEDYLSGKAYQRKTAQGNAKALEGTAIAVISKQDDAFFAMKALNGRAFVYSSGASSLARYVAKTIELMEKAPNGFFIMGEGGHIDHGGHGNDGQYMLQELLDFDNAVGVAYEFYKKHPKETLIVVSADHHTGGLSVNGKVKQDYLKSFFKISGRESVETIQKKLSEKGITCSADEVELLKKACSAKKGRKNLVKVAVHKIIDSRYGISWKTRGHTADEVYLFAVGACAEQFAGKQENSDVGAKLKKLVAGNAK